MMRKNPHLTSADIPASDADWHSIGEFALSYAVDEAGGLTLVECKLDANVESKRTVIGQVFEYAGALWRMEHQDQGIDTVVFSKRALALRCSEGPERLGCV
jgi:hypothetical protein